VTCADDDFDELCLSVGLGVDRNRLRRPMHHPLSYEGNDASYRRVI
jgi:hypothetical protein